MSRGVDVDSSAGTAQLSDVRFDFSGKTVLVTGASRGIGRALAKGFAEAGANLILTARSEAALQGVVDEIDPLGNSVMPLALDQREVGRVSEAIAALGDIDVLVNNAGIEDVRPALEIDEPLWDKIVDTNLKGAFFVAQSAARQMGQGGAIVNLASLTSFVGVPTAVPYGASKTGVLGLTRALATEWGPKGIRVNAIAPGYFHTDMTDVFYEDAGWVDAMTRKVPLGRLGRLEDLVGTVLFLSSGASAYLTGQCIVVDGGYLAAI